jgi:hypothetical protein
MILNVMITVEEEINKNPISESAELLISPATPQYLTAVKTEGYPLRVTPPKTIFSYEGSLWKHVCIFNVITAKIRRGNNRKYLTDL